MHQQQTAFENIVGKGEIAHNEQFLLFPQCFLLNQITVTLFVHIFDIISLFAAEFEEPKVGIQGKVSTHTINESRLCTFTSADKIPLKPQTACSHKQSWSICSGRMKLVTMTIFIS